MGITMDVEQHYMECETTTIHQDKYIITPPGEIIDLFNICNSLEYYAFYLSVYFHTN